MAIRQSTADRERAAAARAIQLGYVVSKYLGNDELPYVLHTESGLTLDQLEELLDVLERPSSGDTRRAGCRTRLEEALSALYGIEAIGHVLGLDPSHRFDRTALAALIERQARRTARLLDAVVTASSSDLPQDNDAGERP